MRTFMIFLLLMVPLMGKELLLLMDEYPPLNYTENGKLKGFSVDIITALQEKLDHKGTIKVLSRALGHKMVSERKDFAFFSVAKTQENADHFKWVGPIADKRRVFYKKRGSPVNIGFIDEAVKYKICVRKDDEDETYLKDNHFPNVMTVIKNHLNVKRLIAGKCDLWLMGHPTGEALANSMGLGPQIEMAYLVDITYLYVAFNKHTPDSEIARWQGALDEMKTSGEFMDRYEQYFAVQSN